MPVTVIIPARLGSSRFPDKPLAPIAGMSLIERACRTAGQARGVGRVAVATDAPEIARVVEAAGFAAVMTRAGHTTGSDRVAEAARRLGLGPAEIVVNLQGDQPLCPPSLIEAAVQPLRDDPALGLSTAAVPLSPAEAADPAKVKVVLDKDGFALYFSRSPLPYVRDPGTRVAFYKHLGVYAFRMAALQAFTGWPPGVLERAESLEQLRALENGLRIKVVITDHDSPAVDRPEDVALIEALLARRGQA
jgi:3-deoxy-manno-octulosonate cytidylyltransferase (CMP-KDO synthetase)